MLKGYIVLIFLMGFYSAHAQEKIFTEAEQALIDSILKDDEFVQMLKKSLEPQSYLQLSICIGNAYFSVKNKRLNASQLENRGVITPSVSYFHKSGFGIAAYGYLSSFNNKMGFYQYSVTPSYALVKSKRIAASFSYTRTFSDDKFPEATSPITHDLYATAHLKKPWLEPGLSFGISGGRRTEMNKVDTVLLGIQRVFTDTVKTSVQSVSFNGFIQHSFEYYELLSKKDALSICPKIIFNCGSNRYKENHHNPFVSFVQRTTRKKSFGRLQENTGFGMQSLAFNLDVNYLIGKFVIEPQAYLDYYLPDTIDERFTGVYSLAVSYTF